MAREGGIAIIGMTLTLCFLLNSETTHGATFRVGDEGGWTSNVSNWPNGKTFKAGDVLEFVYNNRADDVVVVDKTGYELCIASSNAPIFLTGDDKITLKKGGNYFISTATGHCDAGTKIAVDAH